MSKFVPDPRIAELIKHFKAGQKELAVVVADDRNEDSFYLSNAFSYVNSVLSDLKRAQEGR